MIAAPSAKAHGSADDTMAITWSRFNERRWSIFSARQHINQTGDYVWRQNLQKKESC